MQTRQNIISLSFSRQECIKQCSSPQNSHSPNSSLPKILRGENKQEQEQQLGEEHKQEQQEKIEEERKQEQEKLGEEHKQEQQEQRGIFVPDEGARHEDQV